MIHIEGKYLELRTKDRQLIARVEMSSNCMFPLQLNTMTVQCLASRLENDTEKWHLRYVHLYLHGLKLLKKNDMVQGLPNIELLTSVCPTCVLGKQTRQPFSTEEKWRATRPLQLIHTDLCGPFVPLSIGGNKYFITFVDDFSRKIWIYFVKEKSVAFEVFKIFKTSLKMRRTVKLLL